MLMTPPEETSTQARHAWFDAPPAFEDAELPAWWRERAAAAWDRFAELPVPTRTDQAWRFADLSHLRFEGFAPAAPVSEAVAADLLARAVRERPEGYAAHFVFANNRLLHADCPGLPEGVFCLPFAEALASEAERVRACLGGANDTLGGEKLASLLDAADPSGIVLLLPKGCEIDRPVLVHHFVGGEGAAVFPRTLVVADGNASAEVVELFESISPGEDTLVLASADLHADHGARLRYVALQDLFDAGAKLVQFQRARAGRDASIKAGSVHLGAEWVRQESINRMAESGADVQVFSANLANGAQEYDQRTLQSHEAQHTTSDLFFKNALYDKARTIFSGLIHVLPGAHHTDSYQSCRNLLGSDTAEANSMPGLEIDADQVKCSHGSTSGAISDEEIFYLRARGIPAEAARRMISLGFLHEALARLEDEALGEFLFERIERKFASLG